MMKNVNYRNMWAALLVGAGFLAAMSESNAALFNRRAAQAEASDPSAIQFHQTAASTAPEAILPVAVQAACCRPACIAYKMHKPGRSFCCNCPPPMRAELQVKNPADCCCYCIPVCLPGCCDGAPTVDCRAGILGRGVVRYTWCCGFEIKIVFRARGDVVVNYYGGFH